MPQIERAEVESYRTFLKDKHRPPSRGGNTRAWHQHALVIAGETYAFLAPDARKWVYKGERVSFDWEWDDSHRYRNVRPETVMAWGKDDQPVVRGSRGEKRWRTADPKMPVSRREQGD